MPPPVGRTDSAAEGRGTASDDPRRRRRDPDQPEHRREQALSAATPVQAAGRPQPRRRARTHRGLLRRSAAIRSRSPRSSRSATWWPGSTRSRAASPTAGSGGSTSPRDQQRRRPLGRAEGPAQHAATADAAVAHRRAAASSPRSTTRTSCTIFNFVEHGDDGYIVMEYVRGASLRGVARRSPRRQQRRVRSVAGRARDRLHPRDPPGASGTCTSNGLLYCDFKPDNVMPHRAIASSSSTSAAVYRMGDTTSAIYGTPGYQAPEIADTGPTISSDLYTVGRTLDRASARDAAASTARIRRRCPRSSDVPLFQEYDSLYRFLVRATAADPDDRFQSADEMAVQLVGVLREIVAARVRQAVAGSERRCSRASCMAVRDAADDWRRLPAPLVAADDPAAGFLAAIAAGATEPEEVLELLAQAPERTVEVRLREVRALIEADRVAEADAVINEVARRDPWEWRVAWYSGAAALVAGRARPRLGRVPQRVRDAARRARAQGRDGAGRRIGGRHRHGRATGTTSCRRRIRASPVRCSAWRAAGSRWVTSTARSRPTTASRRRRARTSTRRWPRPKPCSTGGAHRSTVDEVVAAGGVIALLPLPREQQARLTARVLTAALELVADDGSAGNGSAPVVLGYPLTETDVRLGLESTYRKLARSRPRAPSASSWSTRPTSCGRGRSVNAAGCVACPQCGLSATDRGPVLRGVRRAA